MSIGTSFRDYKNIDKNPTNAASKPLNEAFGKRYKNALKVHSKIYKEQFNRMQLDLGENKESVGLTTTEQIVAFTESQDPALVTLLTQFGRYLLICSSQPNGQPANLRVSGTTVHSLLGIASIHLTSMLK